jgi:hypothetical protein
MDAKVLRFPVERRLPEEGAVMVAGHGAVPAPELAPDRGTAFAILSLEVRREVRRGSEITPQIAEKVLNRVVLAALETLSGAGATITVAGTPLRPVIQVRYDGEDASERAVVAADAAREAVRTAQRSHENEYVIAAAVAAGRETASGGIRVSYGRPESVAVRLRENAPDGQIVLTDAAWEGCEHLVEVLPTGEVTMVPGARPVGVFVLREVHAAPQA